MKRLLLFLVFGILFLNAILVSTSYAQESIENSFKLFSSKSFKDKTTAINEIADSGEPIAVEILDSLLNGNLYYHKKNKDIITITETSSKNFELKNPITDESFGSKTKKQLKKEYKKVGINNKLRRLLNEKLAALTIYSEDKDVRLNATRNMLKNPTASTVEVLREAILKEQNNEVKDLMKVCIAAADARSTDVETQLSCY